MIFSNKFQNKERVSVTSYGMEIKKNTPLKQLTTFKVGGKADYFCRVSSIFKNPNLNGNKIHLAKVLEDLGMKGLKRGDVGLYENQPLVVVNSGDATAQEIKTFVDMIVREVFKKTKIKITPEVIFVGEF